MNSNHERVCGSPEWAEFLAAQVVPWCLDGLDPVEDLLELGGGYGAATALLLKWARQLTVIENDESLAVPLAQRFPAATVSILDATSTGLPGASFDAVACFTMLHHVSPAAAQDRLFAEAFRLLRPGGWFAGTDSLASERLLEFHDDDVYEPVDPQGLPQRLRAAGFSDVETEVGDGIFRFRCGR
jgi:SAM-dependent methyltransferase